MDRTDSSPRSGDKRDSVVIVALPDSMNRRVYDVSSEKKPHLTLLFLGETDFGGESAAVVQFIEHAAKTSLRRFGLSVTRRGTLGDNDADVLFFDKDYLSKEIEDFRAALLGNPHISTAYNQAEQYPEWIPHLTLGYPDAPAREDDEDYEIGWVNFDRIAIWTGDSEGPEFLLSENRMMEVAMSSTAGADAADAVLSHYGIKGMKWGVRRTAAQLARAAGNRTAKALDDPRSEDAKQTAEIMAKVGKKGDLSRLSNSEIQALTNRINMEQNYARLAGAPQQGRLASGKAFATTLAVSIAKEQITRAARGAAAEQVNKAALKRGLILDPKAFDRAQKAAKAAAEKTQEAAAKPAKVANQAKTAAKVTVPKSKKKKAPKSYKPTPINVNPSSISVRPTD